MREQGDAERSVAGLEHRDILRGIVDQEMMPLLEPRGDDDHRFLRRGAGIERRLDSPWRGEIDQNVGHGRELRDIADLVNTAAALSRFRYRGRERDAHPARAAVAPEAGHKLEEHTSELQ